MPPGVYPQPTAYPNGAPFGPCPTPNSRQVIYPPMERGFYREPAFEGGVQFAQPPPHVVPPFRSFPLDRTARGVLNAPSGFAPGPLGAAQIAFAETLNGSSGLTIFPTVAVATNVQQTVLAYTVPQGFRARVAEWGAELGHSAYEQVLFALYVGSQEVVPEVPLAGYGALEAMAEVMALATEGQVIQVRARNLDPGAPQLVELRFRGWLWRSLQQDDSLRGSLEGSPFAIDTNGRFGQAACPPPNCPPQTGTCQ